MNALIYESSCCFKLSILLIYFLINFWVLKSSLFIYFSLSFIFNLIINKIHSCIHILFGSLVHFSFIISIILFSFFQHIHLIYKVSSIWIIDVYLLQMTPLALLIYLLALLTFCSVFADILNRWLMRVINASMLHSRLKRW